MKNIRRASVSVMVGGLLLLAGCHHPRALYEEPERPPFDQGRKLEQKHQYAGAAQQYERIDNVIIRDLTLNQLLSAWDSVNANIARSQAAVQEQPNAAQARLRLAQDYYNKGLLCTRYTKGIVGSYPQDFLRGEQEFFYNEALLQAEKAIRLQPDLLAADLLISEIYLANRRRDEALQQLKRLIGSHPDFARGYYALGKVYFDSKDAEKTERYLIRAILLDPALTDAYYVLGKFYFEQGWFEGAAATFLEILRKNPQDRPTFELLVNACHELGKYYLQQAQYDQAMRLFQAILKVKSSYPVHQSMLLARQKQKEALQQQQAQAAAATPKETGALRSPGAAAAGVFADQSLEALVATLEAKDDAELGAALKALQENKFDAAAQVLQAAPEKNQANPARSLALALAQQKLGKAEDAKQTLRQLTAAANAAAAIKLAAWTALRNLGEQPDQQTAAQVLGVVIEVPIPEQKAFEVLTAYSDGSVQHINVNGRLEVWNNTEGNLADLAKKLVQSAQGSVNDFALAPTRPALQETNVRISLLTAGGVRSRDDNAVSVRQNKTSGLAALFAEGTNLLQAIVNAPRG